MPRNTMESPELSLENEGQSETIDELRQEITDYLANQEVFDLKKPEVKEMVVDSYYYAEAYVSVRASQLDKKMKSIIDKFNDTMGWDHVGFSYENIKALLRGGVGLYSQWKGRPSKY